jgi:hypothetical protein
MYSIQLQLTESIQAIYKDSVVKKVNKDNFVDIYLPNINNSKGTHLFFNTANSQIKLGFYVRDIDFINKVLSNSFGDIESNSQGLRLKGNPKFDTVDLAIAATKDFLRLIDLSTDSSKLEITDNKSNKNILEKPIEEQVSLNSETLPHNISKSTSSTMENKTKQENVLPKNDLDLSNALSQLMDLPLSPQTSIPNVKKPKNTLKQVKPKKVVTTPNSPSETSTSIPKTKISWFASILEFLGKLFKK